MENDGKYYLNVLEALPNGKFKHWLTVGFGRNSTDFYIFDPRVSRDIHISNHTGGNVHIKKGKGQKNKIHLFNNPWINKPLDGKLKQAIYFRPSAADTYPILDTPPDTLRTENITFKNNYHPDIDVGKYPNMVIKILLGPPSTGNLMYRDFHNIEGISPLDVVSNDFWSVGIVPLLLAKRASGDVGTFIWLFNTFDDIHDKTLFEAEYTPQIDKSMKPFMVSTSNFSEGEVVLIYYQP